MADITLSNIASAQGTYNGIATAMTTTAVATLLTDGLEISKAADRDVWVNGYLTYTITLTNNAQFDYVDPVVTDILDTSLVSFVDQSVTIDGTAVTGYTYDSATGTLSVTVPTVAMGATTVITFQVERV